MTARERREREVQKMAKRLAIASGFQWSSLTLVGKDEADRVARYVLRLLAAERRKAAKRMKSALVPHVQHYGFDRPIMERVVNDAILNGGRK